MTSPCRLATAPGSPDSVRCFLHGAWRGALPSHAPHGSGLWHLFNQWDGNFPGRYMKWLINKQKYTYEIFGNLFFHVPFFFCRKGSGEPICFENCQQASLRPSKNDQGNHHLQWATNVTRTYFYFVSLCNARTIKCTCFTIPVERNHQPPNTPTNHPSRCLSKLAFNLKSENTQ